MTIDDIQQLKRYSLYDGIYLAVLWSASFACLILTDRYQPLSIGFMLAAASTPFFVGWRLKKYRDEGLQGVISFRRAMYYCLRVFFNAALLFSIVQYFYMKYMDCGHLFNMLTSTLMTAEATGMMKQMNLDIEQMRTAFQSIGATQFALTYFVENLIIGILLSLPISFIMKSTNSIPQS